MFGYIRRWGVHLEQRWGPPPWRRGHYEEYHRHHDRRPDGRQVIGSVVGGIIGGILGSQANKPPEPPPPEPDPDDELFQKAIHFISAAPEGAEVRLTAEEFRAVVDRDMIKYDGIVPYAIGRKISIID